MSIFDLLGNVIKPVAGAAKNVATNVGNTVLGSEVTGKIGANLQNPNTYSEAIQNAQDLLPYALTLGLDSPKLPEIALQLREKRLAAAAEAQNKQNTMTNKFFEDMGYTIAPAALPSLNKMLEAGASPTDIITKAEKANWIAKKPPTVSEQRQIQMTQEMAPYMDMDAEALQNQFISVTDPKALAAIQKAATLKKVKLKSAQTIADENLKAKEKAEKEAEKKQKEEEKRNTLDKSITLDLPAVPGIPYLNAKSEEKVNVPASASDVENWAKLRIAIGSERESKTPKEQVLKDIENSAYYKALNPLLQIKVKEFINRTY